MKQRPGKQDPSQAFTTNTHKHETAPQETKPQPGIHDKHTQTRNSAPEAEPQAGIHDKHAQTSKQHAQTCNR